MAVGSSIAEPSHLLEMPECCSGCEPVPNEAPRKRRRVSPASAGAEDEGVNSMVVAKSVRALLKSLPTPVNCGAEALTAINAKVQRLLLEAAGRAHDNGRKTFKASDL